MISPGICQCEIKLQAFMLMFMFMQTFMFRSLCTVCQLQWLLYGVFNNCAQWSYCHFQPKWCYDCTNLTLMKNKTKPQGVEERCSFCVTASGCRFNSQLYRMLLVWPVLEEENTRWLSLLPRQTEALSHWTQVCVYHSLADSKHRHWGCTEEWCLPHIPVCCLGFC